jgi:hypothetical protein
MVYVANARRNLEAVLRRPAVKAMIDAGTLELVDPFSVFCWKDGSCDVIEPRAENGPPASMPNRVLYWDQSHLTVAGSLRMEEMLFSSLRRLGALPST